nr:tetratricopeptide repeat protein [Lachnospiraceae bacterium]
KYTPPLSTMRGLPYMNGFMELIDKAMDKNRSRRFPSAKKMLSAMEHLRKQDIRYKKYVLLQVLSIFLVALFAAMGIFCIVRGAGAQKLTEYSEAFSGFLDAVDTKSSDAVIKDGLQLLNDQKFQDVFERQPQDRAQVLHALGDCYYEEEDYEGAQEKYEEAVSVLPESSSDIGYYYLDYAISLSKCGKSEQAETTLEKAGSLGVDTSSALLIEAGTRQLQGDKAGCEDAVNKLLKENSSISLCVKGCMMMVAMSDNPDEKVVWLEKAACYSSEAKIRRALGVSYVDCANEQSDIDEKKKFAGKALKCYQDLCKMENPTMEDRLGLAIVYHMLGQNDDSLKILKDCEQTDASDYRVSANMAFVYDSMNDSHNASMYCELAIRQISELADAKKQKAEDILSQLKTLRDKVAKEGVQP